MADSNNNIIVSRIQHRRGLKQDLPQPLRPGEIGVATDSRQVYIGGDPSNPVSQGFNSVSYFENTLGARDHTTSIANNQIIAFQVPYIKFTRGEFDGITDNKSWYPDTARSILSSTTGTGQQSKCKYSSSDYPVFGNVHTTAVANTISNSSAISSTVQIAYDSNAHVDSTANIRIGDLVTHANISNTVIVSDVSSVSGGNVEVVLTESVSIGTGEPVTFTPQNAYNMFKFTAPTSAVTLSEMANLYSDAKFTSTDVIVRRNGIKIIAEENPDTTSPTSISDYAIDADSADVNSAHVLKLRTRPSTSDEVSLCYYSNANVIQSFTGINGNIAAGVPVQSFYTAKSIPAYRQIPAENVRLSETTGLGYIALDQKHIVSAYDGANIANPSSVTLGTLLLSRTDQEVTLASSSNVIVDSGNSQVTFTVDGTVDNILANVAQNGTYGYSRVYLTTDLSIDLDEAVLEIESVTGNTVVCTYDGVDSNIIPEGNFVVRPVLSIDLSGQSAVKNAIPVINKEIVTLNAGSANEIANTSVFPYMNFLPQTDGTNNAVYLTSKASFTSIGTYGVDFRIHNDSANTATTLGLTESLVDKSTSVKAKLEDWLNGIVVNRDVNLFTNVFTGGAIYAESANNLSQYNLIIDSTNGEILFCDRPESEHFNRMVNKAYNESSTDRLEDSEQGIRGLLNLKNNLELQTREAAVSGQSITSYTIPESETIPSTVAPDDEVFRLGLDTYNTFSIDYSIVENDNSGTEYMRTGTMLITARIDKTFGDANSAIVFRDTFSSLTDGVSGTVVEPKFQASVIPAEQVAVFSFEGQPNPLGGADIAHNLGTSLKFKYVINRWSSTS